jgi:hypothetical protein
MTTGGNMSDKPMSEERATRKRMGGGSMKEYYKAVCKKHNYGTSLDMMSGTAVSAARLHSLLPCSEVKVFDQDGVELNWKEADFGIDLAGLQEAVNGLR